MSVLENEKTIANCKESDSPEIHRIILGRKKDLGTLTVRRVLPSVEIKTVGPWIFFDHMGPAQLHAGKSLDVRPHPHINLATVTYLFEGEILHRDSLGSVQAIHPGAINLMVAGRGIAHSERERPERTMSPRTVHGLQLWMALPEEFEEVDPEFLHYSKELIPTYESGDITAKVLIGKAHGLESPVKTFSETLYVHYEAKKGSKISLPESEQRAMYVVKGSVKLANTRIEEGSMIVLNTSAQELFVEDNSTLCLVGGEKMPKRYIYWNFVSSRKEKIEQAKKDWKDNKFPAIPGDDEEFIPLPKDAFSPT